MVHAPWRWHSVATTAVGDDIAARHDDDIDDELSARFFIRSGLNDGETWCLDSIETWDPLYRFPPSRG